MTLLTGATGTAEATECFRGGGPDYTDGCASKKLNDCWIAREAVCGSELWKNPLSDEVTFGQCSIGLHYGGFPSRQQCWDATASVINQCHAHNLNFGVYSYGYVLEILTRCR